MKFHREELDLMQTKYAEYLKAENLDALFNGEMKTLLGTQNSSKLAETLPNGLAIAAAVFEKRCQENPEYADKLAEFANEIAAFGVSLEHEQIEKAIKYRDKWEKIDSINSLGEVETDDYEIQKEEEADAPTFNGNLNDLGGDDLDEDEPQSEFSNDSRALLGGCLKAHAVATDVDNPDKGVVFNHVLFNEILEDKSGMQERIQDKDFLFGDMAESELNVGAVPEDVDPNEAAAFDAATRLKTYMTLEKRSQNRSFLDVLKHPFNTFKEWRIKKNLEKDIKNRYGLDKEALGKMTKEVLDTDHPKNKKGYEVMDKDFVAFTKSGDVISTQTHTLKDVNRIGSIDYPDDPNFDAKIEARNKAAEEKARAEQEAEPDDEKLDTSKLGDDTDLQKTDSETQKSPFLTNNHIMLTGQEIDMSSKN